MTKDKDQPNFKSSQYQSMQAGWQTAHDAYAGTPAVRAEDRKYLPQWPRESQAAYEERLDRSVFYNAFRRTVESLCGLVFKVEPQLAADVPGDIREMLENADFASTHWTVFAKELFSAAIRDGHAFLFVDMPGALPDGATLADEREQGRRPYWVQYEAMQALNWRIQQVNGTFQLAQITFEERTREPDGMFGEKEVVRYRVLTPGAWQVYEATKEGIQLMDAGVTSLNYIPVAVVYGRKTGYFTSCPPLGDLVDLNLAHYRIRSDLWHVMHVANVPILYAVNRRFSSENLEIGPNTLIDFNEGGSLAYAEHSGAAIGATQTELSNLEKQMAILGLATLADSSAQMTATERLLDYSQETSELATMARSLKDCLESALGFMADYLQLPEGGSVNLRPDAGKLSLDANKIAVLSSLVEKGQLTLETLWTLLQGAGELPDSFDPSAESQALEASAQEKRDTSLRELNAFGL